MKTIVDHLHRSSLTISTGQLSPGHSAVLHWHVIGVEASVASVHLATEIAGETQIIEAAGLQGEREIIFAHAGDFQFTLTVTFGDGTRLHRKVTVHVVG